MGRIATVVSIERAQDEGAQVVDVQCDPGGGAAVTAEHFAPPGDDSLPLPGDSAALEDSSGSGREQISGYLDPKNEGQAAAGEKRLYSRATDGSPVAEVWLKNDGSILVRVLKAGGAELRLESEGPIIVESPDVRLGPAPGRKLAGVGDFVVGSLRALSGPPGAPIVPVPPAAPTPTGGVGFVGQIVSGFQSLKGGT